MPEAVGVMTADGQEIALQSARSDAGFFATVAAVPESWHFLQGTLPPAAERVSLHVVTEDPAATISIWVWEDRPGREAGVDQSCCPYLNRSRSPALACCRPRRWRMSQDERAPVRKRGED